MLFVGSAALITAPMVAALAAVPPPISDAEAEEAFTLGFKHAPALTWEWGKGFSLGGKPVTDEEAAQWDAPAAYQTRLFGEEHHKRTFKKALRAEFHREYGPNKTDSQPLPPLDLDESARKTPWDLAYEEDVAAWLKFRAQKETAGLLPDWYIDSSVA